MDRINVKTLKNDKQLKSHMMSRFERDNSRSR